MSSINQILSVVSLKTTAIAGHINAGIEHISAQLAFIGTQYNKADTHADIMAQRKISISERVADLGEADLAALITELQALLLNKEAAQNAFAKIGQQNLFDFLR